MAENNTASVKRNNFLKRISSKKTLENREIIASNKAENAWKKLLNRLDEEKTRIEMEIENHLDIGPDTTDSLKPVDKNWDADKWAVELHRLNCSLDDVTRERNIAIVQYTALFSALDATEE